MKLAVLTRTEPGYLQYDILEDNNNPNHIILVVKFSSPEAMQKHEQQEFVKHFAENEGKQYCEKISWHDAKMISKLSN